MPEFKFEDIVAKYNVVEILGKGGQKIVFGIDHPVHGACVLKIGSFSHPAALERIVREVETLRSISSDCFPRRLSFSP
jgi:hypothetical protein